MSNPYCENQKKDERRMKKEEMEDGLIEPIESQIKRKPKPKDINKAEHYHLGYRRL